MIVKKHDANDVSIHQTVSYEYNSTVFKQTLTDIFSLTSHYSFSYDNFGNKTSTSVGGHTLATYQYNNAGFLTRMDYGNNDYVTYEYDKFGNTNKKYLNGSLAYEGIADNTGAITRSIDHINHLRYDNAYDSTDRLVSTTITDTTDKSRKAMYEYNFDLNNNISKYAVLTPTGSNTTSYTYGADNLMTSVILDNGNALSCVYDGLGRTASHTLNLTQPITVSYGYLDSRRVGYTTSLIEKEENSNFSYKYEYDSNGNIIKLYTKNGNNYTLSEEYSYDNLGILEEVKYLDRNEKVTYNYDECGDLLTESVYDTSGANGILIREINYDYDDPDMGDLLTKYDGQTLTYDQIGNPLNYRDGITFTWSNGRQLQSYTKDNATINYTYDSSGIRLSKTIGGTTHTYLYNSGLLIQERIGNQKLDYSYTPSGQILSVKYTADVNSNETPVYYYYALNSRGDVVGLYDHEGKLYAKYTYDVWGNPVSVTNANDTEITSPTDFANIQPIRYRSYYYDSDTGFYYLQSRYYDPVTHRFINADGLVSTGTGVLGYNMFIYCDNNPNNLYDPSGNHASNITCGDPTCVICNPFRRQFLQSEKGIRQYNKCNGTHYIGMDDNGNFISNEQIIEHQYWGSLSTEVNNIAGPTSTLLGSVGYSTLGTSYLGCASSPFSCLSYQSNPYLNNSQKTCLISLEILCAGSGVAFAMIIANLWNPVGWAALAVTAAGIGLAAFTSYTLSQQEIAWETENKEKWGCYYW